MDKTLVPSVSIVRRCHCIISEVIVIPYTHTVKDRERVFQASLRQSQWRALSRYHNQYTPVISITHLKYSSVIYKNMTSTTEEVTPEIHQKIGT